MQPVATVASAQEASARVDRIPRLTPLHLKLMVILIALFIFDIIDLFAFGYTAPAIREQWQLSIEELGLVSSSVFVGMVIGGLVGGRLADRFGRRALILVAVTIFSVGSLGSALAPTPEIFVVTRVITGIGLTATTGAILVMVSEIFPRHLRGRVMSIVLGLALLGGPITALFARVVVPAGAWHLVFVMGSLGIVVVAFSFRQLPESPKWLASRGRFADSERVLEKFDSSYRHKYSQPLPPPAEAPTGAVLLRPVKSSYLGLFQRPVILRTIVATVIFSINVLLTSGFGQWLPVVLVERGYPQSDAITLALILSFGTVLGALLAFPVIDRFERKWMIAVCTLVASCGYLVIGFVDSVPVLIVAGLLTNFFANAAAAAIFTYVPEIFPVAVRGTGAGVANGVGRLVGVFGSIIIAAVLVWASTVGVFVYMAFLGVLLVTFALMGPRVGVRTR